MFEFFAENPWVIWIIVGVVFLAFEILKVINAPMNVINKVYDMNLTTLTRTPKIRFHATPYALLSADDIAIATSKGWAVQAG